MMEMNAQDAMVIGVVFAIVAALILVVDALLVIIWLWHRDAVVAGIRPPLFARRWSLVDPWVGGQAAMAALIWIVLVAMIAMAAAGADIASHKSRTQMGIGLIGLIVQNVLLVAIPVSYMNFKYGVRVRDVGFTRVPTKRQALYGVVGGVALMLLGAGTESAVTAIASNVLPSDVWGTIERLSKGFGIDEMFPDIHRSWLQLAGLFVGAAIAAPIGEEFFFRAFLHNCAKRRLGAFWGTLLSATAFALVHGGPLLVLAILPMGVLLAWMYDRTQSLWVPIIVHAVNNGVSVLAMGFLPKGWP